MVDPERTVFDVPDYEDNLILDLVKACDADILVADDTDLTPLSPWNGRPILRPKDFVHQILHRR